MIFIITVNFLWYISYNIVFFNLAIIESLSLPCLRQVKSTCFNGNNQTCL